jgi:predicted ribosome quality control (RQC) complex YloA/Tae2 family protein
MKVKEFKNSTGMKILVGQDDYSNDQLTFKIGKANDLWFHVSGSPGSHVLLQCADSGISPDKESIREAAEIAAWFSKMRQGGKVAVKYCLVKNVHKPKNARPGTVYISKEKTIIVRPKEPEDPEETNSE